MASAASPAERSVNDRWYSLALARDVPPRSNAGRDNLDIRVLRFRRSIRIRVLPTAPFPEQIRHRDSLPFAHPCLKFRRTRRILRTCHEANKTRTNADRAPQMRGRSLGNSCRCSRREGDFLNRAAGLSSANLKRTSGNLARTADSPPIDHAHHHVNGVFL